MTSIQVQRGKQVTQSGALFVKISFLGSTPLVFINPSTNSEWEPVRQCYGLPLRPLSQCLPSRTLPAKCGLNGKKANLELAAWKTKQQQVQVNTFCWKNFRLYSTTGALSCSSRSPSPSPSPFPSSPPLCLCLCLCHSPLSTIIGGWCLIWRVAAAKAFPLQSSRLLQGS